MCFFKITNFCPQIFSIKMKILNPTSFFEVYINFLHLFCISPFRVTWFSQNLNYSAKSWLPQKVLCVIMGILAFISYLKIGRDEITSRKGERHPTAYFQMAEVIINLTMKAVLCAKLWLNRDLIVDILNIASGLRDNLRSAKSPSQSIHCTNKILAYIICILCAGASLANFVSGAGLGLQNNHAIGWWTSVQLMARNNFNFLLGCNFLKTINSPFSDIIFGLLGATEYFHR